MTEQTKNIWVIIWPVVSGVLGAVLSSIYWVGSHDTEHEYMTKTDEKMGDGIGRISDDISEVKSDVKGLMFFINSQSKLVKLDQKSEEFYNNLGIFQSFPVKVVTNDTIYQWQTFDHAIVSSSKNRQIVN